MCAILYFFLIVCNKPHANPTIIYENIKEIHVLAVGGTLEFPILSHMLLRRAVDLLVGTSKTNISDPMGFVHASLCMLVP